MPVPAAAVPAALGVVLDAAGIEGVPERSLYLPEVATAANPVTTDAGTAVIGITIFFDPSKDCAVAVTPDNPIVLAVASLVALPALPETLV